LLGGRGEGGGGGGGGRTHPPPPPRDGLTDVLRPLLIAWSEQARGRTDAALRILHPLTADGSFRAVFALHAGLIADLAGRAPAATQAFGLAAAGYGTPSLRLAQMLASFYTRHGRQADAMRVLAQASDVAPEIGLVLPALSAEAARPVIRNAADGIAEAYVAAASSLRMQDHGEPAMLLLRLALDLRPDFTAARLLEADLLAARNQPEQARHVLDKIAADDALAPLAQLHRAGLMQRAGDTDGALRELDALARDCKQSPLPLAEKAGMLRAKGRFAEAAAVYDQAIARLPAQPRASDWVLFYERGVALDQAHDWTRAEADLRHALELSPDQALVLNYLGYSWADKGMRLAEARRMIEKAVRAEPNDGAMVDSLGWVMLRTGDLPGAVRTLERASELMPNDATVNGHLGDAYAAAGRKLEAGYQWRRALMLHPEAGEAERLRAKLDDAPRQSASAVPMIGAGRP
jgi:tetratricopeptide (TPR) repeat protein